MLQKTTASINFAQGLNTKSDPKQVPIGQFLALENTIFTKAGLLQKRNGFQNVGPTLPNLNSSLVTTLNGGLTAVGESVLGYSSSANQWVTKGTIQPLALNTMSLIRNNFDQTQCDVAIAPNGLMCTIYSEVQSSGSTSYKYAIADSSTGQNIVAPTTIQSLVGSGTVTGAPRVFGLGSAFIIVFTNVITATSHLQYVYINSIKPTVVTAAQDIASSYISSTGLSWDGVVSNNNLYIAYDTTSGGQAIKITYLTYSQASAGGSPVSPVSFAGSIATLMSLCVDSAVTTPVIYASFYDSGTSTGYVAAVDQQLNVIQNPVQIISTGTILNITAAAQNGVCKVFYEVSNNYSYDSAIPSHFINSVSVTAGVASSVTTIIRSLGLASKAFIVDGVIYFLGSYQSTYQSTYFMINGSNSLSSAPVISSKLAYSNGGGYLTTGLPNTPITDGNIVNIPYLFKNLIQSVNKDTAVPAGTATAGVYAQTGVNLAKFTIGTQGIDAAEIANDLHISGGFLWMYDGYLPVEHNFFLWPDMDTTTPTDAASWSDTGGNMAAKPDSSTNTNAYFYQVTYEWSDNQGNLFRSAPSIPIAVTTTNSGTSGSVTLNIPTLRLTYKTANPVKICIYRWSVAQQVYYQVTSLTHASVNSVLLNSTTADSVQFVDTLPDASIIGNNILYTTGGVVEDVNAPASNIFSLFDTRLWLVDAEDQNLLWFSKAVIEATPVEMSDLFTMFISPSIGVEESTGPITGLAAMDDKLIIFKKDAIYYINGTGPDNTGANSQYSQPIFITSTVGCSNQSSIVLTPDGLMFQSDKGIWILGRDLSSSYIGAQVEAFNTSIVQSAVNVPATTQIRFTLDTGQMLMYDYFYKQWGSFVGAPAISSCVFNGYHTILNGSGQILQETPGSYLDGSNPVLISFKTSWFNLVGLQGYQRAYEFHLLGTYLTPHKLNLLIAYDYNDGARQSVLISPTNFSPNYGNISPYGQGQYGGPGNLEQWRVFLQRQRCQAFQITLEEVYDPSFGVPAGEGLTLSGLNLVYAAKRGYKPISNAQTAAQQTAT